MRITVFLCLLIGLLNPARAQYTPPKDPDLQQIYRQAQEDKSAKRYQASLEKYLWLHHHALDYDSSFYGVRLSFALGNWVELARVYPPAMSALVKIAEQNLLKIKETGCCVTDFHDFVSINQYLNRQPSSTDLFKWLDTHKPFLAKRVYDIAQPALVLSKEYRVCGKYIDGQSEINDLVGNYQSDLERLVKPGSDNTAFIENRFINKVTTLVALLAVNNRTSEANVVAARAKEVMPTELLEIELKNALAGEVPHPWP